MFILFIVYQTKAAIYGDLHEFAANMTLVSPKTIGVTSFQRIRFLS